MFSIVKCYERYTTHYEMDFSMTNASTSALKEDMSKILGAIFLACFAMSLTLTKKSSPGKPKTRARRAEGWWMHSDNASKRDAEKFILKASMFWIASLVVVVATEMYEKFSRWHYFAYCGCCAPLE